MGHAAQAAFGGLAVLAGAALAVLLLGLGGYPLAAAGATLWWIVVLIVIRSDLKDLIIPDSASLTIAVLGLAYALGASMTDGTTLPGAMPALAASALNGGMGFAFFWLVARVYASLSGREGLGFGDVKLAGASAIWLDPAGAVMALEIAALAALAVLLLCRRGAPIREIAVPFGAFLAPSAWLAFVAGPALRVFMESSG